MRIQTCSDQFVRLTCSFLLVLKTLHLLTRYVSHKKNTTSVNAGRSKVMLFLIVYICFLLFYCVFTLLRTNPHQKQITYVWTLRLTNHREVALGDGLIHTEMRWPRVLSTTHWLDSCWKHTVAGYYTWSVHNDGCFFNLYNLFVTNEDARVFVSCWVQTMWFSTPLWNYNV